MRDAREVRWIGDRFNRVVSFCTRAAEDYVAWESALVSVGVLCSVSVGVLFCSKELRPWEFFERDT